MKPRHLNHRQIVIAATAVALLLGAFFVKRWLDNRGYRADATDRDRLEYAASLGRTNTVVPSVLEPIKLSAPIRLAVGGLGLTDDDQNRQLGDLVTTELTGTSGFTLVERSSINAILHELNLSRYGLVRAQDAVRVGKLLKVDWFLLGTEVEANGKKSVVVRLVNARSGIILDAGVLAFGDSVPKLARDCAQFVRESRENAAKSKVRVYLAIGTFEDLSVNDRLANFPGELRAYLTAAYRGSDVTLLEREDLETLLREVDLDLAGLTEDSSANPPRPMQSAFWLVSGQYQSYETTDFQVELNLSVSRAFSRTWESTVRARPGAAVGRQARAAIDEIMRRNTGALALGRANEARLQLNIGKEMSGLVSPIGMGLGASEVALTWVNHNLILDPQIAAQKQRKLKEAIRALKTALMLEPTNREAMIFLGACLRDQNIDRPEEARSYYQEIINDPVRDKWSGLAQTALLSMYQDGSFDPYSSGATEKERRWFQSALAQTTNAAAIAFYRQRLEALADALDNRDEKAQSSAEQELFACMQSCKKYLLHKPGTGGSYSGDLGMEHYRELFHWKKPEAAQKLAELLPKMESHTPELKPYIEAIVLTYQVDTNPPLVAKFQQTLNECVDHPEQVLDPEEFWGNVANEVYDWCFEHTNYPLAVTLLECKCRVSQEALEPMVYFDDSSKMELAYAYLACSRWRHALDVAESFTNRPVQLGSHRGPWGDGSLPILTDRMADYCRQKLGLATVDDPRKFKLGKPVLNIGAPAKFIADDDGFWIGANNRLMHLDFEMRTNLVAGLPVGDASSISAICVTPDTIWIATQGYGLIEYDKASRLCHSLTQSDGLLMDNLTCLMVADDTLWIGYGGPIGGGLGKLDLHSRKVTSFTPSLNAGPASGQEANFPREPIGDILPAGNGDLWIVYGGAPRRFRPAQGTWETLPYVAYDGLNGFCADADHVVEGARIAMDPVAVVSDSTNAAAGPAKVNWQLLRWSEALRPRQYSRTNNSSPHYTVDFAQTFRGGLVVQGLKDHQWRRFIDPDGFPYPPSALTLAGNDLWVGSCGTIARMDLASGKVNKICHVPAAGIDRLQIAGGYLWAQCNCRLYRVALSALQ